MTTEFLNTRDYAWMTEDQLRAERNRLEEWYTSDDPPDSVELNLHNRIIFQYLDILNSLAHIERAKHLIAEAETKLSAAPVATPSRYELVTCDRCNGRGSFKCWNCTGHGELSDEYGNDYSCPACKGEGREDCMQCKGTGKMEVERQPVATPSAEVSTCLPSLGLWIDNRIECPVCHKRDTSLMAEIATKQRWECDACEYTWIVDAQVSEPPAAARAARLSKKQRDAFNRLTQNIFTIGTYNDERTLHYATYTALQKAGLVEFSHYGHGKKTEAGKALASH